MEIFDPRNLRKLYKPPHTSSGEDNGQVTIIGGSSLFHGAPILALKVASRIVDMVFFASSEPGVGQTATKLKSALSSFIWVPWEDIEEYVSKSDAVLIGPGFMRFSSEKTDKGTRQNDCDKACQVSKNITEKLLKKFPDKPWVIDAGSLQTMEHSWIPANAILTPNRKEFELLFGFKPEISNIMEMAKKHNCTIVVKGPRTLVISAEKQVAVTNGNAGLTKGGTGDVMAGLTVALLAKNDPFLAASAASFLTKASADELYSRKGTYYNADDLAEEIPFVLNMLKAKDSKVRKTGSFISRLFK